MGTRPSLSPEPPRNGPRLAKSTCQAAQPSCTGMSTTTTRATRRGGRAKPHARVPSTVQACAGTTLWRCSLRRGWRQISDGACSQATLCNCVLTVCSVPRALRPSCIAFMTSHRTFLRLDFGEVLRASRQRVVRVATACVACTSAHPVCNVRARCNPGCHRKRTRATTGIYLRTRRTPRWTSGWLPTT